jgi:protein-S-isoprenylcysteine O-methyltransferase Ste14
MQGKIPFCFLDFLLLNSNNMENKKDSPRVYIPPPLFYVLCFIAAIKLQQWMPINDNIFHWQISKMAGMACILTAFFFLVRSLRQFILTRNTLVTMLPAKSLETGGIYSITRNPMYTGLFIVYIGLSCLIGNWWNFIFLPFLFIIVQEYIIKREEKYLERRFGAEYLTYKSAVRRWL